jgi:hypothetical protein
VASLIAVAAVALSACGGAGGARAGSAERSQSGGQASAPPFKAVLAPHQLSVAEELGPDIVTVRVVGGNARLDLQINTLTGLERPAAVAITVAHTSLIGRCGLGCTDAYARGTDSSLTIRARIGGVDYSARLPIRFVPDGDAQAAQILNAVDTGQTRLRTAAVDQSLRGSPTTPELTVFRIAAPDRFAYRVSLAGRALGQTVIVGDREWSRSPGEKGWQPSSYGAEPFSAAGYLDWWASSAGSPRLLDLHRRGSIRIADIAALTNIPDLGPVWFRLRVDASHDRLLRLRMITADHFMTQTWSDFNAPTPISAPAAVG